MSARTRPILAKESDLRTEGVLNDIDRLASRVGVPTKRARQYDWVTIEASLGLRLPQDYKLLLEAFPDGVFRGSVQVNRPGDYGESSSDFLGFYAYGLEDMRGWRENGRGPDWAGSFPYPIFPEPGGLLPWARGPRLEPIFWLTEGSDPNAWPVVLTDYNFTRWQSFPCTACQFLYEFVEGTLDASLLDADSFASAPLFEPVADERPSVFGSPPSFWSSKGNGTNEFLALAEMVGAPSSVTRSKEWTQIEEGLGLPLPEDYKSFIDRYGPGVFCGIVITAPGGPVGHDLFTLLENRYSARADDRATAVAPVHPDHEGMIAWGVSTDGWTFSWAPNDPEPGRWGVVLTQLNGILVHLPDQSFSSFLRKLADPQGDIGDLLGWETCAQEQLFLPCQS